LAVSHKHNSNSLAAVLAAGNSKRLHNLSNSGVVAKSCYNVSPFRSLCTSRGAWIDVTQFSNF